MNRSRLAVAVGAAVLVVAGAVLVPMLLGNEDQEPATAGESADGGGSLPAPAGADELTGLDKVFSFGVGVVEHL